MDITDRKKAEEHVQLLMREITHRSKNLLAVVQAIAGQTAASAGTLEEFQDRFIQRLRGLAASHDLLVEADWRGARLHDLIRQQLAPFAEIGARLQLDGPSVTLTATAAQAIGMALHELATNATKYGAWSVASGRVVIAWTIEPEATAMHLDWIETGGPLVIAPARKGFGHIVLENIVTKSVHGEVHIKYEPAGLQWHLSLPTENLTDTPGTAIQ